MKGISLKYGWLLLAFMLFLNFCQKETCEDTGTCPEQSVIERIDIDIQGDIDNMVRLQSAESNKSADLIAYNLPQIPSQSIDFILKIADGHQLKITVYNNRDVNPWEHESIDYGTYPTQALEDKWKYVTADYIIGTEVPIYSTNIGNNHPSTVTLDVFHVTRYDEIEIRCRIRDMVLYKNTNPSKSIEIDGTFVGAVTFL